MIAFSSWKYSGELFEEKLPPNPLKTSLHRIISLPLFTRGGEMIFCEKVWGGFGRDLSLKGPPKYLSEQKAISQRWKKRKG